MKILYIEAEPLGLPFLTRCVDAGHTVYWYSKEANVKGNKDNIGEGFKGITRISNWVQYISKVDLTINGDNNSFLERLDSFRAKGYKIYSPTVKSAELEIKREIGLTFLEDHGIKCPPYIRFNTYDEAIKFLLKDKKRYVMKTLGDEEDKSLSYCSKDAADMIEHLLWLDKNKITCGVFILQEFIKGIEFAVNSWMSTKGFIGLPGEAFEHKGLAAGEKGPATGEMGTIHKYNEDSLFFDRILKPLEKDLVKLGHLGNIDVNCIIDDKGDIHPLEFTARHPYPGWQLMLSQHNGDPVQWMLDACNGLNTIVQRTDIGITVVLVVPPFPFEGDVIAVEKSKGLPIYGITTGNRKHLQPQFVKMAKFHVLEDDKIVEKEGMVTAGTYFMCVNALGDSIEQCQKRVYKTIDQLHVPGMFYRNDIGEKCIKWLPELQSHGYGLEFK